MHRVESSDPGNRYGAIYLWGTTGLGMLPDRVKQLAPDAATDSWDLLFKAENARRLAACGIIMMDSAIDVVPGVLKYLGRSPDSTDAADLAAVEHTLMGIRRVHPQLRVRRRAGGVGRPGGAASRSTIPATSSRPARVQQEAKRGVTVRYVAPKEGAQLGFDMMAIPQTPGTRTRRSHSSTSSCGPT